MGPGGTHKFKCQQARPGDRVSAGWSQRELLLWRARDKAAAAKTTGISTRETDELVDEGIGVETSYRVISERVICTSAWRRASHLRPFNDRVRRFFSNQDFSLQQTVHSEALWDLNLSGKGSLPQIGEKTLGQVSNDGYGFGEGSSRARDKA